jgi:Protein of unknown function (DUF402)
VWSSGDAVQLRYVHQGRVSRVIPATVVSDVPAETQLLVRASTSMRTRCGLDGVPLPRSLPYAERFALPWRLGDGVWTGANVLMIAAAGAAHSVWVVWDESWEFVQWYVNLQEPLRRSRFGFDTADNVLDLVVERDRTWRWKDEDELVEAVRVGRFTAVEADELRREGERVVALVDARAWPFDRDWSGWRPRAGWTAPTLVEGCDEL